MSQLTNRWVRAEDMVRSRAWREGFESLRLGQVPEFMGRGSRALAYEYGRQTAAMLLGEGARLPLVSARRPVVEAHVPRLAAALCRVAGDWTGP